MLNAKDLKAFAKQIIPDQEEEEDINDYEVTHLDYKYIEECTDIRELKKLLKVLKSGKEGYYFQMEEAIQKKLEILDPSLKIEPLPKKEEISNELNKWIDELNKKDSELRKHNSQPIFTNETNENDTTTKEITFNTNTKKKKENPNIQLMNKNKSPLQRIKSTDYRKWDLYNVDEEIKKIDGNNEENKQNNSEITDNNDEANKERIKKVNEYSRRLNKEKNIPIIPEEIKYKDIEEKKVLAEIEKNKGNDFFKSKDYEESLIYYTRSLDIYKMPNVYTNRALVNLKLSKFLEAELDATEALKMNDEKFNFKAYLRRGESFYRRGRYRESIFDFSEALKLNPANSEARNLLNNAQSKYLEVEGELAEKINITLNNTENNKDICITEKKQATKKRMIIKEVDEIVEEIQEISDDKNLIVLSNSMNDDNVNIDEKDNILKENKVKKIEKINNKNVINDMESLIEECNCNCNNINREKESNAINVNNEENKDRMGINSEKNKKNEVIDSDKCEKIEEIKINSNISNINESEDDIKINSDKNEFMEKLNAVTKNNDDEINSDKNKMLENSINGKEMENKLKSNNDVDKENNEYHSINNGIEILSEEEEEEETIYGESDSNDYSSYDDDDDIDYNKLAKFKRKIIKAKNDSYESLRNNDYYYINDNDNYDINYEHSNIEDMSTLYNKLSYVNSDDDIENNDNNEINELDYLKMQYIKHHELLANNYNYDFNDNEDEDEDDINDESDIELLEIINNHLENEDINEDEKAYIIQLLKNSHSHNINSTNYNSENDMDDINEYISEDEDEIDDDNDDDENENNNVNNDEDDENNDNDGEIDYAENDIDIDNDNEIDNDEESESESDVDDVIIEDDVDKKNKHFNLHNYNKYVDYNELKDYENNNIVDLNSLNFNENSNEYFSIEEITQENESDAEYSSNNNEDIDIINENSEDDESIQFNECNNDENNNILNKEDNNESNNDEKDNKELINNFSTNNENIVNDIDIGSINLLHSRCDDKNEENKNISIEKDEIINNKILNNNNISKELFNNDINNVNNELNKEENKTKEIIIRNEIKDNIENSELEFDKKRIESNLEIQNIDITTNISNSDDQKSDDISKDTHFTKTDSGVILSKSFDLNNDYSQIDFSMAPKIYQEIVTSSYAFNNIWKYTCSHPENKNWWKKYIMEYFPCDKLAHILENVSSLESILSDIFKILNECKNEKRTVDILSELTKLKRFSIIKLFFTKNDRKELNEIFNMISQNNPQKTDLFMKYLSN